MYQLLKANTKWKWDDQCHKAFKEAKQKLMEAPVMVHYDPSCPLKLATDASAYGIGAVLSHCYKDGSERAIACTLRTLTSAEKNYVQIDKELIYGVQKFHVYLYGLKFILVTLTFLVQLDNGMFWKRHVEQLRWLDDTPRNVTNSEASYSFNVNEEIPNDSSDSSNSNQETEQSQTSTSDTASSTPVRRYPVRVRRPPKQYQTDRVSSYYIIL